MNSTTNMDILETILRSAQADKYIENFRNNEIEATSFKLLTEEDLILIGVAEESVRKKLLDHIKNLQIASEKKFDLTVDESYARILLNQINNQLMLQHANLACAVVRKDVIVCDIQLGKASRCLIECVGSLEEEVFRIESKIVKKRPKNNRKKAVVLITLSTSFAFILYRFISTR